MTILGRREYPGTLNGSGNQETRNGTPRPMHYNPPNGRNVINPGTSTTGWAAAAGCTMSLTSVATPEGPSVSLVRFLGTADNTSAFIDITTAPFNGNQLGRRGIEFDIYYAPGEPYSELGSSGIYLLPSFTDLGGNSVSASIQIRQGWQRIRLKKADFSIVAGTGNWDTTGFTRLRIRVTAKANVTHDVYFRNMGYMGGGV